MVAPLPLSSSRRTWTPTTTERRTSAPPSASPRTSLILAHQGDGYTRSDGRVLLHRETGGNLRAPLCRGTPPCGWTTSRPRASSWMSRMGWSDWSWLTEIEANTPYASLCASKYLRFNYLPPRCTSHGSKPPSSPHPDFLDMRPAFGTKIRLGLCSCFFCVHNRLWLAQWIPTEPWLSRTPHVSYFFFGVEPLVRSSAGATPPLYGIVRRLLGWNSRVCGGYEVDIYLICSPHPRCFVAFFSPLFGAVGPIWRVPDALGTTGCANSPPECYMYF